MVLVKGAQRHLRLAITQETLSSHRPRACDIISNRMSSADLKAFGQVLHSSQECFIPEFYCTVLSQCEAPSYTPPVLIWKF